MSFGYGVGDCIAILLFADRVRERFNEAPEQFKAISNEIINLSNVLRNIESVLSLQVFSDWQKKALASLLQECHNVLIALGKVIDDNDHLNLSNIHGFHDKSRRVWKRLTWEPHVVQELRSRIALNVDLLNAFNGSLMSKVTLENRHEVQRLHERYDKQDRYKEYQVILDWLTPINNAPQQHDFISRRQAGTGQWLFDSEEFQAWLDADRQTLFCPGIPGAGKTILTSIVIEDLHTRFQNDSCIGIAYLYCNFKRSHEHKLDDLLLSLLKQLAQGRLIPDVVRSLYDEHKCQQKRPSTDEISKALHSVISSFSKAFIIIDALDECQVNDRCRPRLISEIFSLQAKCSTNLFVTSRFIPEITDQFQNNVWLEIRASDDDLRRYLDSHMVRLPKCVSKSPDLQEKIKDVIVNTVDGMFLLAQLHLDSLTDKTTPRTIKRALGKLPKGSDALDLAYKEATRRIQGQEPGFVELAWRVLSWITCARRPLTSIELQHALAIEAGDSEIGEDNFQDIKEIVSLCAGLVTIDQEGDIIRLVHYTAQEYFEQIQISSFPDAQKDIAVVCITYLSFNVFETDFCLTDKELEARLRLYPLYNYAAQNWGHHARAASTKVERLMLDFLESEQKVLAAGQAMIGFSQQMPGQLTGVHLAVFFQLNEAISALIKNGNHPDTKDNYGQTPLSWAAENGHEAVVRLLLENGAELESEDNYGQTPLLWATRNGHEAAVRLLLERGAQLESKDNSGRTLLLWAARKGHEAVVRLLLEKGAELESKSNNSQVPLLWAARNGHEAVVRLLLGKGAGFRSKDNDGRTPLSWAAESGHEGVVKLLLDKGAEFESKDNDGRTPLLWATRKGHEAVVRLLLEKGANLESGDNNGRTPLVWAVRKRHKAVERLLLENGAKKSTI